MKKLCMVGAAFLVGVSALTAGGTVKSGPQTGQAVPGPFHPLNLTGAFKGEKHCLYCQMGTSPVAVVFARELNPNVAKLIKQLDSVTAKNSSKEMGSFVVFLSNDEKLPAQAKNMAMKQGIKTTILSVDNPAGPEEYKIAKNAEVTVLLYDNHTVRANHSFAKGQLNPKAISTIVADVAKILPK